jgi:hypothetical protein
MIIGISGKKQVGKNTVGDMINFILSAEYNNSYDAYISYPFYEDKWEMKSFANKLKLHVANVIGCNVEMLEDEAFKNKPLGEEWIRYAYATGSEWVDGEPRMVSTTCDKERFDIEYNINWQTAYKLIHTPRTLMQMIGTNVARIVHKDYWVNALMVNYFNECNWIITDVRFPNEIDVIKQNQGIVINIKRNTGFEDNHKSETALDNIIWNEEYLIDNNGSFEELYNKVFNILVNNNLIK